MLNPEIKVKTNTPIVESIRLLKAVIDDEKNFDLELRAKSCAKLAHLYYQERSYDKIKELYIGNYLKLQEKFYSEANLVNSPKCKRIQDSLSEFQKIYESF